MRHVVGWFKELLHHVNLMTLAAASSVVGPIFQRWEPKNVRFVVFVDFLSLYTQHTDFWKKKERHECIHNPSA